MAWKATPERIIWVRFKARHFSVIINVNEKEKNIFITLSKVFSRNKDGNKSIYWVNQL